MTTDDMRRYEVRVAAGSTTSFIVYDTLTQAPVNHLGPYDYASQATAAARRYNLAWDRIPAGIGTRVPPDLTYPAT